ncbi:MAG: PLP-dependent transferase [Puia sp.]
MRSLLNGKTKLIWAETPTNPLMNIVDLAAVASLAKEKNILFCVGQYVCISLSAKPVGSGCRYCDSFSYQISGRS